MANRIVVLGEHRDGRLKKISWEAIGLARKLSAELGKDPCLALVGSEKKNRWPGSRGFRAERPGGRGPGQRPLPALHARGLL